MGYDPSLHAPILEAEEGHPWFEARADLVVELLRRQLSGVASPAILDLGCGTGLVASRLSASIPGALVAAVDLSVRAASRIRPSVRFVQADLMSPPFRGGFDAVLLLDVIEHFRDDAGVLRIAGSLLAPGGRLVVNAIRKEERDKDALLNLDYPAHLWLEKEIKSVANVTRRDVQEFLDLAAEIPLKPDVQIYNLEEANRALVELKQRHIRGAKVLRISP